MQIGPQVRIRDLRVARGLSIPQLAERIGAFGVTVHPDSLSNIELGHKQPSEPLLAAWADALGVNRLDISLPERPKARRRRAA